MSSDPAGLSCTVEKLLGMSASDIMCLGYTTVSFSIKSSSNVQRIQCLGETTNLVTGEAIYLKLTLHIVDEHVKALAIDAGKLIGVCARRPDSDSVVLTEIALRARPFADVPVPPGAPELVHWIGYHDGHIVELGVGLLHNPELPSYVEREK